MDSYIDTVLRSPLGWIFAGVWGALWGSFFNVCIHRIGLYESVMRPRSRCPACGAAIRALDNIPLVSWIVLGGRCRDCRAPISWRYPLVELFSILLALGVYNLAWKFPSTGAPFVLNHFFLYFAFLGTLLVLAGIDLDHKLLPNRITYPAIPLFLLASVYLGDVSPTESLFGMVLGYGLVALTVELSYLLLRREGMGYGDAKLLALIGAFLGWRGALFAFFGAPFIGLAVAVPILVVKRQRVIGVEIPFGPFLAAAATIYVFGRRELLPLFQ